jgi:hypothetical protein
MAGETDQGQTSHGTDQHYGVPAIITSKDSTRRQKCLAKKPLEDQDRDERVIKREACGCPLELRCRQFPKTNNTHWSRYNQCYGPISNTACRLSQSATRLTFRKLCLCLIRHYAMMTYGREGIAPRILKLDSRRRQEVSFTPRPLYPMYPLDNIGGWVPGVWTLWRAISALPGSWTPVIQRTASHF